jgi:hypothetical protein
MARTDRREASQGSSKNYVKEKFFNNQFIGAIAAALIVGVAGLFAGIFGGSRMGLVPEVKTTATATATATVTASPSARTSSRTPHPAVQSSLAPAIPILAPKLGQPGWTLAWHQDVSIGPQGIIFGPSGYQVGNGSSFNLQYLPGSDDGDGWQFGNNSGALTMAKWTVTYAPDPGTINGISQNSGSGCDECGQQVNAGDRWYITLDTDQKDSTNMIAYMQVIKVGQESVVADIWTWTAL